MQINKAKKLLANAVLATTAVLGVPASAHKAQLLRTGGQSIKMNASPVKTVPTDVTYQSSFNNTMQVTVAPPASLMGQELIGKAMPPAAPPPAPMG